MISPSDAEAAIRKAAPQLPAVATRLEDLGGTVLREAIVSSRDQPPFDRVTMDGIAFSYASYRSGRRDFRVSGTQAAGAPQLTLSATDACIEVMTGAIVPTGCDCVVPVEKLSARDGIARVHDDAGAVLNGNIHSRGFDCCRGDRLIEPGARLGAAEIAVIASTGQARVSATRSPRIVVISTGDELVEPGLPVTDWQIYRSNAYAVVATLRRRGFRELANDHLPDDLDALRTRLRTHLDERDVLILSGGVSMGRFDYVPRVLSELGVSVVFHKVAQRPGKPMWFGVGARGQTVYALPGNPVSTLVCLMRYVLPGLDASMSAAVTKAEQISLTDDAEVKPELTLFVPVKIVPATGGARARLCPTRGSGDFTSLLGTDGFVELPAGPRVVSRDEIVSLYRW
jgi:molybdopterin molybdotransferase